MRHCLRETGNRGKGVFELPRWRVRIDVVSGASLFTAPPEADNMTRRRQIYEGKAKILYEGPVPGTLIQYFKDDATAFNAQK